MRTGFCVKGWLMRREAPRPHVCSHRSKVLPLPHRHKTLRHRYCDGGVAAWISLLVQLDNDHRYFLISVLNNSCMLPWKLLLLKKKKIIISQSSLVTNHTESFDVPKPGHADLCKIIHIMFASTHMPGSTYCINQQGKSI